MFAMNNSNEQQNKLVDDIIKINSALYEKATAYTNVVILAGYVAFFSVWNNMKVYLTKSEMLQSASAVTFSLIVFISWEI